MPKTYYDILDIPPDATQDQIQEAYRTAVKFFHPDRQSDQKMRQTANEKMKAVNEAYDVLRDIHKREGYNRKIGVTRKSEGSKQTTARPKREERKNSQTEHTNSDQSKDRLIFKLPDAVLLELVRIPAGKFLMGSDNGKEDQKPQHQIYLPEFYIGRFPITNAQYLSFVRSTGREWGSSSYVYELSDLLDSPAVYVSWHDAQDFCAWMSKGMSRKFRLPTEAEWEKAARGEYGKEYPWGDEFDKTKCNTDEPGIGTTTPVGKFSPQGDSPYGVADMAGNVWEWCQSKYKVYPYNVDDGREDLKGEAARVLRGGSFNFSQWRARGASRFFSLPSYRNFDYFGFRVVVSPIS